MLEIYENIKKYRKMNKWTQEELAKKVGYGDRSTISRIERGEIDLPQSMIVKFAKVFGLSAGELAGSDGTAAYMDQLSAEEQRLIAYYRKLSEPEKDMICRSMDLKRGD